MGAFGNVDITIRTKNITTCTIENLDAAGNSFQSCEIDVFEGDDMGRCEGFEVPDYVVETLIIKHSGADGWKPEWFRIFFLDGALVQCFDGEWIDNNEDHEIRDCSIVYETLPRV